MRRLLAAALMGGLVMLGGCDRGEGGTAAGRMATDSSSLAPRQTREMIFVGRRQGEPLAGVLAFRTVDGGSTRAREIRGWLGHGSRWETFLDERWAGPRSGSAWTLVPYGPLRVAAGGPAEVEALWYRQSGRHLRLELDQVMAQWNRSPTTRTHLFSGTLSVGGEATQGTILELLQLRRPREDPPGLTEYLLLAGGDSVVLFVAADQPSGNGNGIAWLRNGAGIREWSEVSVMPRGSRALPEARREIPRGWGLSVPEAGIRGEVRPLAFTAEIGLERAGQRAVEARYTVTGWVEIGDRRLPVAGIARHAVD